MSGPRQFDYRELAGADETGADEAGAGADLGQVVSAARAIQAATAGPDPRPSDGLADRIMAAVAREPVPGAIGIVVALRRRPGLGGLTDSLRVAWSRATAAGRPASLRLGGVAYLAAVAILVASLSGAAAYATAGAIGLFGPPASHEPDVTEPAVTPGPLVSPSPTELESAEPSESPEASDVAEPSDDHGSGGGEPANDNGATPSPRNTDDGGDSGSDGSESQAPQPTRTLEPGEASQATPAPERISTLADG